jgi:peroxiredoxin
MIASTLGSGRPRLLRLSSILLATSLAWMLLLAGCFDSSSGDARVPGPEAPTFDLPLLDGGQVSLSEQRGKVVILDFWATWCAPCEIQMPVLDALWEHVDREEWMIIGISVDQVPANEVVAWVAERGFRYPIALGDPDLAMRYGVIGYPTLVVIDPQGRIFERHTGVWSRPEIEEIVAEIRRKQPHEN